jgi:hypothetical protein
MFIFMLQEFFFDFFTFFAFFFFEGTTAIPGSTPSGLPSVLITGIIHSPFQRLSYRFAQLLPVGNIWPIPVTLPLPLTAPGEICVALT